MAKNLPVVKISEKILRLTAKDVSIDAIKSKKVQELIEDMNMTLSSTPNGVGLAAPQVDQSLRIFIVSEEAEEIDRVERNQGKRVRRGKIQNEAGEDEEAYKKREWRHYVFINPKVLNKSRTKLERAEGCLSVPGTFGELKRFEKITISAFDERGKKFIRGATRFFARVIQHELDHLDGVLFSDKAKNLIDEDEIRT